MWLERALMMGFVVRQTVDLLRSPVSEPVKAGLRRTLGFPDGPLQDDRAAELPRLVVEATRETAESWDAFAQSCGASFWCSWGGARMWQLKLHSRFRLRRLDLLLEQPQGELRKIGQCVIGVGRRVRVFSDGIVLRPDHRDCWPRAMECVLAHVGPGRYVYGSFWSAEEPRQQAIAALGRTWIASVRPLVVESIDLKRFDRWDDLLRSMSRNISRNAKNFRQAHAGRRLIERRGLHCLRFLTLAVRLRGRMYDRKHIVFSRARAAVNYVMRSLMLKRYVSMRVTSDNRRCLAAAGTVSFGKSVYFLDGASEQGSAGAGWDLLLEVLEDAHQSGHERFLLGYTDVTAEFAGGAWESPVRYRRDCRAQALETSIVAFDFAAPETLGQSLPAILLERTEPRWSPTERP